MPPTICFSDLPMFRSHPPGQNFLPPMTSCDVMGGRADRLVFWALAFVGRMRHGRHAARPAHFFGGGTRATILARLWHHTNLWHAAICRQSGANYSNALKHNATMLPMIRHPLILITIQATVPTFIRVTVPTFMHSRRVVTYQPWCQNNSVKVALVCAFPQHLRSGNDVPFNASKNSVCFEETLQQ
jgi:hypothetical protein